MSPADFVQAMGAAAVWPFLTMVIALVGALVVGVFLVQGKRVPVGLGLLPLVVPAGVAVVLSTSAAGQAAGQGVPAQVGVRLLTFPMFTVPALFLLLFAGVAGALTPTRDWRRVGARLLVAAFAPISLVVYALAYEDWAWPGVRVAFYTACALLFALAGLSREGAAPARPDAVGIAGVAYALTVGVGEGAGRAFMAFFLLVAAPRDRTPEVYAAYTERGFAEIIAPLAPWSAAAVALAVLAGLLSLLPALRSPQRGGAALALLVFALVFASAFAGHLTPDQAIAWLVARSG